MHRATLDVRCEGVELLRTIVYYVLISLAYDKQIFSRDARAQTATSDEKVSLSDSETVVVVGGAESCC